MVRRREVVNCMPPPQGEIKLRTKRKIDLFLEKSSSIFLDILQTNLTYRFDAKRGSIYIEDLMTPGAGILVLGRG